MKLIYSFCFLLFFMESKSQDKPIQSLSVELGKNGFITNIVYDYQFSKSQFGYRGGAGTNFAKYLQARTITAGGYKLFGNQKEFFELGIDIQYLHINEVSDDQKGIPTIYPDHSINTLYPSLNIGYRKINKKSIFRIGIAPGVTNIGFMPGAYLSLGIKW